MYFDLILEEFVDLEEAVEFDFAGFISYNQKLRKNHGRIETIQELKKQLEKIYQPIKEK